MTEKDTEADTYTPYVTTSINVDSAGSRTSLMTDVARDGKGLATFPL